MNVFKTWVGKLILFLFTIAFTMVTGLGIAGIAACYEYGMYRVDYSATDFAGIETHDEMWARGMALSLYEDAKEGSLPKRAFLAEDYGYEVKEAGETISYGTSRYYDELDNECIGYNYVEIVEIEGYTITIWAFNNLADAKIEKMVTGIAEQYKAYWHYLAGGGALLTLICFVGLMCVSGRKNKIDTPVGGLLKFIPFDIELGLAILFACGVGLILIAILEEYESFSVDVLIFSIVGAGVIELSVFYGMCMEIAARIKLRNLFSYTLIGVIVRVIWRFLGKIAKAIGTFIKNLPFIWVGVLVVAVITIFELIGLATFWYTNDVLVLWVFEKLFLIPVLIYIMICMHRLHVGSKALAAGALSHKTDTKFMLLHFKEHGNNLNKISDGISLAVNEKLKSEHMKTELITNVSHDIKTPLTSIINYSDLISKEECDNEKIHEYAEVISRQSGKLKRLLEDLLELSKSSTGNVTVNPELCDAGILLEQATGEYEEKLSQSQLTPVISIPEESIFINADRRLLWRVFDNLLSNMSKYALAGTRAYFTLSREGDKAVFRFKNTSREMLNISAEELKARFVRGDASRNTEGNGLGLSIAENLINVQGGKLDIFIDADLFVATITFDCVGNFSKTTQTDSVIS